jgi:hypothetical protein
MSTAMTTLEDNSYYFVSLGRERGGLLDVLGLPPNASELEIGNKEAEYKKRCQSELKNQLKEFNKRLQTGEITKEEVETKTAELKEQKEGKLTKLNEVRAKFDKQLAERRIRRREGKTIDDESGWSELLTAFPLGNAILDALLMAPLARFTDDEVARITSGQLTEPGRDANDLAALRRAVGERRLLALLHADRLWERVKHTNRQRWTRLVQEALADGTAALPRLSGLGRTSTAEPLFPTLSQPLRQEVASLRAESLEDQRAGPRRGQQNVPRALDFRDLLAALPQPGGRPAAGMPEVDVEAFRRFMAAMMAAEAQNKDADE